MALAALILLAACSPSQTTSPSANPSASTAHPAPLLVVAARPGTDNHATVSIVTAAGAEVASASFDLASWPLIGPVHDYTQPPIRVAAGAAFYADAQGVVRRLDRDGRVTPVDTFPLSAQQELSFAVSPDGTQLIASILSAPPLVPQPDP